MFTKLYKFVIFETEMLNIKTKLEYTFTKYITIITVFVCNAVI